MLTEQRRKQYLRKQHLLEEIYNLESRLEDEQVDFDQKEVSIESSDLELLQYHNQLHDLAEENDLI